MKVDDALLADILEHPDDDTPRLVYADWLDDQPGRNAARLARAEFIRIQCELARLQSPHRILYAGSCSWGMHTASSLTEDDARARPLRRRERQLLEKYGGAWAKEAGVSGLGHRFRRGFVDSVDFEARKFFRTGEKVLRGNPIRDVSFRSIGKEIERIASSSCLSRVSSLSLHSRLGDQAVGPAGAAVLARSPHLAGLTSLDITYGEVGNEGLRALAESPHLARLQSLNLYSSDITSEGVRVLVEANHWPLTALGLGGNDLSAADVELLAGTPHLANLQTLHLWTNDLDDDAVSALARSKQWRRLTVLDLYCNEITDKGVQALAGSPNLQSLQILELGQNKIRSRGAVLLAGSPHLAGLRILGLSMAEIGSPGAKALAGSKYLKRLEVLDLNDNKISGPGVRALARSSSFTRLVRLGLGSNELDDECAALLASSPGLAALEELEIGHNEITEEGAKQFLVPGRLRCSVGLWGTEASSELRETLGARTPQGD